MARTIKTTEPTRYEVAAINGDRKILVGYSTRKSVAGIVDMMLTGKPRRIDTVSTMTGVDPNAWQTAPRGKGIEVRGSNGWKVAFTGRTQREAYGTGEISESIYN